MQVEVKGWVPDCAVYAVFEIGETGPGGKIQTGLHLC